MRFQASGQLRNLVDEFAMMEQALIALKPEARTDQFVRRNAGYGIPVKKCRFLT
jgi:hypothetical protein